MALPRDDNVILRNENAHTRTKQSFYIDNPKHSYYVGLAYKEKTRYIW